MRTNPNTVQLMTSADLPTAEITVIDGNFQFVHHAVGKLDIALTPGVYTVQYKAGGKVEEVPVVLRPGSDPVHLESPRLTLQSPAPLGGNEAGKRYGAFARDCSLEVHVNNGQGGQLFIFLRTALQDMMGGTMWNAGDNRLFQVTVLDDQQRIVAELAKEGKRADDGTSRGCNLALNPGTYILRFDGADVGALEQSVVVSDGWQTQVFASSRPFGQDRRVLGPNLPEAAVFTARLRAGFDPSRMESMTAESARRGLAERRAVAPEDSLRTAVAGARSIRQIEPEGQVREMLQMKFVNPMFGIYGAHLMLLSAKPDMELLAEVVSNLKTLIGNHPDVIALTLLPELKHLTEQTVYMLPPMLRSSWKLVLAESVNRSELVPLRSYSATIANRTWGAGAWLVWQSPPVRPFSQVQIGSSAEQAAEGDVLSALATLQVYILKNLKKQSAASFSQQVTRDGRLNDTERIVLMYLTSTLSQGIDVLGVIRSSSGLVQRLSFFARDVVERMAQWVHQVVGGGARLDPAIASWLTQERLVQAIGIPIASLNQALVSLNRKLASTTQERQVSQATRGPLKG